MTWQLQRQIRYPICIPYIGKFRDQETQILPAFVSTMSCFEEISIFEFQIERNVKIKFLILNFWKLTFCGDHIDIQDSLTEVQNLQKNKLITVGVGF